MIWLREVGEWNREMLDVGERGWIGLIVWGLVMLFRGNRYHFVWGGLIGE